MHSSSPRRGRFLEGTAVAAFALISTIAVARIGLEPPPSAEVVGVIFSPWTDANAAFTRAVSAGARFIRYGGPSFVVVVQPDSAGYVDRIKAAGALVVVDPRVIEACLAITSYGQHR